MVYYWFNFIYGGVRMQYIITGSSKYVVQEDQIERLCADLGAELIGYTMDKENDRLPYYFIDVASKLILTTSRVQDVFGTNFGVKLK